MSEGHLSNDAENSAQHNRNKLYFKVHSNIKQILQKVQ